MRDRGAESTDACLLAAIAEGDELAFGALARRYEARFFRVARRMLGDDGDAEDAVQSTLLQVFRHAATYRDRWSGSTWLYRVLTNVCVDAARKRRRTPAAGDAVDPADPRGVGGDRIDVDRALARLPPEARAVLLLCYVEELPYADVARARGITVNTVKTQLARAKRLMRRALTEEAR